MRQSIQYIVFLRQACYKASECLGFKLYAESQLERLMPGCEKNKLEAINEIWASLLDFFYLGRHKVGVPVDVKFVDKEMAVICATALLGYLTNQK